MEEEIVRKYPPCPKCGASMRLVKGRFGTFLACSNYRITGCNGKLSDPNREYFSKKSKEKKAKESEEK